MCMYCERRKDVRFGGIQILSSKDQKTVLYGTKDEYEALMSRLSTKLKAGQ